MKIQRFLEHHGVLSNPFAEEDAQTDPVFKDHCILGTYHPAWDKVYGEPGEPATSVVFGEKGAGKTALRLQIVRHLEEFNRVHPQERQFVIEYDDFNPFRDRFREKLPSRRRRPDLMLAEWRLWDHMDAILSLGVTSLVDRVLGQGSHASGTQRPEVERLDHWQRRDLLLLAAAYDRTLAEPIEGRWRRLARVLKFSTWTSQWPIVLGLLVTAAVIAILAAQGAWNQLWSRFPWPYLLVLAGWAPWLWRTWASFWPANALQRHCRVIDHRPWAISRLLALFPYREIAGQPLPNKDRTDDRYELLVKFQSVLRSLGYTGIIVLVDRVDEPHLINGASELMRQLIWSMLDNKFLKHPGLGIKLLLPIELGHDVDREERDFYQRARLDKQNMVPSLNWSGEALFDVANARLQACAKDGAKPNIRALLSDGVSERRLIDSFRQLRVPRHLFRFLYRLLVAHSNAHTDEQPVWQISPETFESTLAIYLRDQDAFDRGRGAG
jgi:hypothetical protein